MNQFWRKNAVDVPNRTSNDKEHARRMVGGLMKGESVPLIISSSRSLSFIPLICVVSRNLIPTQEGRNATDGVDNPECLR